MLGLIAIGYSQADIARELGVTRQAIQKMLSLAPLPRTPAGEARKPAEMPDGPYGAHGTPHRRVIEVTMARSRRRIKGP
jgi:hypothetical protein